VVGEFKKYFKYIRELKFDQDPEYDFLRGIFAKRLSKLGEAVFDWKPKYVVIVSNYRDYIRNI